MCIRDSEYIGILNADRKLHKDALDNYQSSVYCFQKAADTLGAVSYTHLFPRLSALRAYVKAWNAKVVPNFLTVVSTILG